MGLKIPELVEITKDTKNREFFFCDSSFLLITEEGKRNYLCSFDDYIDTLAREYADKYCPLVDLKLQTDKINYINKTKMDYWSRLFHLAIWSFLEQNNKVAHMKKP